MTVARYHARTRSLFGSTGALPSVRAAVLALRPEVPMLCLRPAKASREAARFVDSFPGQVLYAVKCNPDEAVLRALAAGGIGHFDAASIAEVRLVRRLFPEAGIHFMHPVKARSAIREAYGLHGVRDFVLDGAGELDKIVAETEGASDLRLIVRLGLAKGDARLDLSGKFGASADDAVRLLRRCAAVGRVGLSFHVGSQCCDPSAWERALAQADAVIRAAAIQLDVLDVGGGFPVAYPGMRPPPLAAFMAAIRRGVARMGLPSGCVLWCEPGRALVAGCQSLVVQVQARRGDMLFINDGVYGTLSDAGALAWRYPCRLIKAAGASHETLQAFGFFGPTCDSLDRMPGPFLLPADTAEGDWIEIGQLGAYGACLRTGFNGFNDLLRVEVGEPAVPSQASRAA
ncbi:type III PLP-dependent enzyme [Paramagnetospirillum magneticum]|uniref:ornithine decarboxylase n=1 Tax=Paramagnetospirillum magneticum (strain ATCC 700264 / AMB-1) TaxID=342108 RepID=Q2W8C0_PARM1|nr:type III PLP-dependent enzyme [Paramagnetospirillum magneticum]BAE49905.1 Diaminopimelate decarboxylase [Paramagnetospirillum magneticum AMB-1]